MHFHKATIRDIERLASDVISLTFEVATDAESLDFMSGQHTTLRTVINGVEIRRSYSLANSPFESFLPRLIVKLIKGGKMSDYLVQLEEGSEIEISDTQGFFYADINTEKNNAYTLICEGIGFVPMYSMIRSILTAESVSKINLLYVFRTSEEFLLKYELELLSSEYSNRFSISYLSHSSTRLASIASPYPKIDSNYIEQYMMEQGVSKNSMEYFICGQGSFVDEIKLNILAYDVPRKQIHTQCYSVADEPDELSSNVIPATVQVEGHPQLIRSKDTESILSAVKKSNFDPPYACESGICGTCAARLLHGKVYMKSQHALEEVDVENGWILTCCAHACSDQIKIKFE